jgi:hypothetical protein
MITTHARRVISDVGMIFGAASIVTLAAQYFDISSKDTAVFVIITAIVICIMLYSSFIKNYVSSPALLTVVIFLLALIYFFHESKVTKESGLTAWVEKSKEFITNSEYGFRSLLKKTKTECWFVGLNFYDHLEKYRSDVFESIKEGVNFHYIVYNPCSKDLLKVANDFDSDFPTLQSETKTGLLRFNWLYSSLKNTLAVQGSLQIRLYETIPRYRSYFFDPKSVTGNQFFVPYVNKISSQELPGFLFHTTSNSSKKYFEALLKLWNSSIPVDKHKHIKVLQNGNLELFCEDKNKL